MSVPDALLDAADVRLTHIEPEGAVFDVEVGIVDIFAIDDQGVRLPVAILHAGESAYGCAAPVSLFAVPRQDARAHMRTSGETLSPEAAEVFANRVVASLGPTAQSLSGKALSEGPGELARIVVAARRQLDDERAQTARAGLLSGQRAYDQALDRIRYSSSTLRTPLVGSEAPAIVAALTILGNKQGFSVVTPTTESLRTSKDPLRTVAHASGLRSRVVTLSPGWQERGQGSYLAALVAPGAPPTPVALMPGRRGYHVQRPGDQQPVPLSAELAAQLTPIGYEFYAPLPQARPASVRDVLLLGLRGMSGLWAVACLMALGVALLGLLTPVLTNLLVGQVIPAQEGSLLVQIGLALVIAALVAFVFSLVQTFTVSLISQRATRSAQAAMWDRVLSLPAGFFRRFSSGDLTVRVMAVDSLQALLSAQVVSALLAAVFGAVNLVLMFYYDVVLGIAALLFLTVTVTVLVLSVRVISRHASESLAGQRQANGWMVQMLQGITKIRIADAEPQMIAQYLDIARRQAVALARQTLVVGRVNAWFLFASSGASALFYTVVLLQWKGDSAPISTASYMAFASAYGLAFAAVSGLAALISPLANAGPTFDLLKPIMEELPETAGDRQDPGPLSGRIEIRDVQFRYTPDGPMILKGLNVRIEPGSMVALVGPSGAGKSTITRLLLGFDIPSRGQVLYDGRDLQNLDPTLVRAQMGVVVQEGRITRGAIIRNILGATTQDEALAWAAAEKAALASDIRAMPMGMQTIVDPGNISGGQAQRILLARALVHNPAVLILDEATSALDNASQKVVTEAMRRLNATRIVVAHRLSTIRSADRIIVMVDGTAVESGTFDELLAAGGAFAALVKRQMA